jgi:hypothetical protein
MSIAIPSFILAAACFWAAKNCLSDWLQGDGLFYLICFPLYVAIGVASLVLPFWPPTP